MIEENAYTVDACKTYYFTGMWTDSFLYSTLCKIEAPFIDLAKSSSLV